ncbi:APC family permease [Actinoplanes sp. KI2]|uniref:APC family permease n=1 Tax=Actinoplanes sp. KI2 TaxID=2983315 RepID=UPI0021D5F631|nr:APC family permease [Actinoplanes sp. KI2]MCU7730950.1 APC family permease [Actinoplanes sp. KI2]
MTDESPPGPGLPAATGAGQAAGADAFDATHLNRVITRPMLTFFILGDVLGAGIYSLVGEVAADVGGAIWASFLVSFLLALVTAYAYLELVTKYPRAAGAALYVHRAYHIELVTFLVTVAVAASGLTSASFAATRVGGDYWTGLFGTEHPPTRLIAILCILLVAAINYRGVGGSIKINIVLTVIELAGLLFIILVGAKVLLSGDGDPAQAFTFHGTGFAALTGILAGAATAFYSFIGFEDSVNMAEEVREPHRNFPPALFTGLLAAGVIYLLVAFTAAMTVPLDVLIKSSGPLLEVVKIGWPGLHADTIFSAVAMIAVSNTMLINMLMASRLLYGMANQGVLPRAFARVSPRKTPWFSIAVTTGLSILLILATDELGNLSDTTVLLLTAVFLLVNITVLVLRRDRVAHPHFVAPTFLPILGAAVGAIFLLPINRAAETYLIALLLLLGGLILWAVNRAFAKRRGTAVPKKTDIEP